VEEEKGQVRCVRGGNNIQKRIEKAVYQDEPAYDYLFFWQTRRKASTKRNRTHYLSYVPLKDEGL